jgi:hypothetical protein
MVRELMHSASTPRFTLLAIAVVSNEAMGTPCPCYHSCRPVRKQLPVPFPLETDNDALTAFQRLLHGRRQKFEWTSRFKLTGHTT